MPGGHRRKEPQQPQAAHANHGYQHRHHGFAGPPDSAGQQLHQNIGNVPGCQELYHAHTDLQNVRVRGEKGEDRPRQQYHHHRDKDSKSGGHGKRYPHTLFETVIFSCAVVLTGKGSESLGHGGEGHPEQDIHFAVGRPGSYSVGSEGVDGGLDHNIGKAVHDRLEGSGNTDGHDGLEGLEVEPQLTGNQPEALTSYGHQ